MTTEELENTAADIRQDIIKMLLAAKSGHSAGPLGMADVFTALFFAVAKLDPKNPSWPERDYIVLSNGHICPLLYATMAHRGFFPHEELLTLRKFGSRLQGHPEREKLVGLETTSGPLGSGLSQAAGMALGLRMDAKRNRVWCLGSDGELEEGNTWEALMFAGKNKLANLCYIVDRNNIQIDGPTEEIMPLEPLKAKFEAFNWHVLEVNGHNFPAIINGLEEAKAVEAQPTCLIAHTIPGKGVDYMEYNYLWHGTPPGIADVKGAPVKAEQAQVALRELRTLGGRIIGEHE